MYTVHDLINDDSFHRFIEEPDSEDGLRWQAWVIKHPDHEKVVDEARQMITDLRFRKPDLSEPQIEAAWEQVKQRTNEPATDLPRRNPRVWYWAAAVTLIMASGLIYWLKRNPVQIYETGYGETIELVLEDSSRVQLNANSSISYNPQAMKENKRKIFLQGEAFFEIAHRVEAEHAVPFQVHTADGVVEVLGTRFNVQSRHNTTQVVLESGSVRFETKQHEAATLTPGDMLEYSEATNSLKLTKVNPLQFTAWRNQRLYFDETSLEDLATILEDSYGKEVVFRDPKLRTKQLSGEISAEKLGKILLAVSRLFSVNVTQHQDTIFIGTQSR